MDKQTSMSIRSVLPRTIKILVNLFEPSISNMQELYSELLLREVIQTTKEANDFQANR